MPKDHQDLSPVDRAILRIVQRDANCRLEEIAEEAGASIATIQRRLRQLRENGVIEGETVLVNPQSVGQGMTFLILVELERERIDNLDAFRRKMASEPQIQQCYYITGEADFALIALAEDMDEYQALIQRVFFEDNNVKRFRTSVVMDRSKVSLNVAV